MSMHKTHAHMNELNEELKNHNLPHDKPSQLADAFRAGYLSAMKKFELVGRLNSCEFDGHDFVPEIEDDWSMIGKEMYVKDTLS